MTRPFCHGRIPGSNQNHTSTLTSNPISNMKFAQWGARSWDVGLRKKCVCNSAAYQIFGAGSPSPILLAWTPKWRRPASQQSGHFCSEAERNWRPTEATNSPRPCASLEITRHYLESTRACLEITRQYPLKSRVNILNPRGANLEILR